METLFPRDERDAAEAVTSAIANGTPLEVRGAGTKTGLGRPVEASFCLSTAGMNGVSLYEPSELVLSAGAGTPLRDITDLLDARGQEFAFEPMDYGALYGKAPGSGTIGGLVAVNASGPRRIKAGAARDHLLGFRAVSGRAEAFKSGGRVMKNVTGYDLSKLVTGSHGTLAVLTEVTVKVLPKAEAEETLLMLGLGDVEAIGVLTEASGRPHEVSSFAHVPAAAAASLHGTFGGQSVTALRLEGPPVSIAKRKQDLLAHFNARCPEFRRSRSGHVQRLLDKPARRHPAGRTRCGYLASLHSPHRWATRRGVPSNGAAFLSGAGSTIGPAVSVWLATEPAPDSHEEPIRAAVNAVGGHATLIRAAESVRAAVPVFHPQPAALAALSARVKNSFDPQRVLNRGRMREDL